MRATGLLVIVSVMLIGPEALYIGKPQPPLLANGAQGGFSWRGGSSYKSNAPSQGSKTSYVGDITNQQPARSKLANSTITKSSRKTSRSVGISAWGIIGVIVGAISLTTVTYYTFALYPYVCKKQRRYDVMELSDVV